MLLHVLPCAGQPRNKPSSPRRQQGRAGRSEAWSSKTQRWQLMSTSDLKWAYVTVFYPKEKHREGYLSTCLECVGRSELCVTERLSAESEEFTLLLSPGLYSSMTAKSTFFAKAK